MNKTELIAAVAEKSGLTHKVAEKFINAFVAAVKETVAEGEKVQLIGFGTFEGRKRNARTAKNPQTGETISVPEAVAPAFKAGKAFKDVVNTAAEAKKKAAAGTVKRGKKK